MKNTFLSLALAVALVAPAPAQNAVYPAIPGQPAQDQPAAPDASDAADAPDLQVVPVIRPVARAPARPTGYTSLTPRGIEIPRNTIITPTKTETIERDGTVQTREVATRAKLKPRKRYE